MLPVRNRRDGMANLVAKHVDKLARGELAEAGETISAPKTEQASGLRGGAEVAVSAGHEARRRVAGQPAARGWVRDRNTQNDTNRPGRTEPWWRV